MFSFVVVVGAMWLSAWVAPGRGHRGAATSVIRSGYLTREQPHHLPQLPLDTRLHTALWSQAIYIQGATNQANQSLETPELSWCQVDPQWWHCKVDITAIWGAIHQWWQTGKYNNPQFTAVLQKTHWNRKVVTVISYLIAGCSRGCQPWATCHLTFFSVPETYNSWQMKTDSSKYWCIWHVMMYYLL